MTDALADLQFVPLSPDRLPDLAGLFGQGGDPKFCWCAWYRVRSVDFKSAYANEHGATLVEAYPADTHGKRISSASAYKGTLGMFERAGFEVVEWRRANRTTSPRPIVRREA